MTDEPDELELLRRANPVPTSSALDDGELAVLTARIERRTMDAETTPGSPRPRPARRIAIAAGVAAVALAGVLGAAMIASGDDDDAEPIAATTTTTMTGEPISPDGAAMCVEMYDLTTLANREVAFDGTVESVDGDEVTFSVNEWFRGGDDDSITLEGAGTIGGLTSAGDGVDLSPGSRVLVSGDGGFAWSCGFTKPYDDATAAEWRDALS